MYAPWNFYGHCYSECIIIGQLNTTMHCNWPQFNWVKEGNNTAGGQWSVTLCFDELLMSQHVTSVYRNLKKHTFYFTETFDGSKNDPLANFPSFICWSGIMALSVLFVYHWRAYNQPGRTTTPLQRPEFFESKPSTANSDVKKFVYNEHPLTTSNFIGGSRGGVSGTRAPWIQFLSFSCSFWQIFGQIS